VRRVALLTLAAFVMLAVTASAFAGPRDPRLHKRPADVTRAKALILKLHDLPAGFVDKGPQKNDSGPTPPGCREPNLHALVETADVSSHQFEREQGGFAEALSETSFFLRPAQAQTAVAESTSSKLTHCVKEAIIAGAKKSAGSAMTVVSTRLVPITETVRDLHTKIWDIFVTFKARGLLFHDEMVLAYFRRGRVVSFVMLNSINGLTEEDAKNISLRLTLRLEALPKSVVSG
jgi:hypothetical protein